MASKYNLTAIVVFVTLVEGLATYLNMVRHPELQPPLAAAIVAVAAIANGSMAYGICPRNRNGALGP